MIIYDKEPQTQNKIDFSPKERQEINKQTKNCSSFIDFFENKGDSESLLSRISSTRYSTSRRRVTEVIALMKDQLPKPKTKDQYNRMKEEYSDLLENYQRSDGPNSEEIEEKKMMKIWTSIKNYCQSSLTLSQFCRENNLIEHSFRREFDFFKKNG